MNFEYEITFFAGFSLDVVFSYFHETPAYKHYAGTDEAVELEKIFHKGEELDFKDIDDHLLDAIEKRLMDNFADWYDHTFE